MSEKQKIKIDTDAKVIYSPQGTVKVNSQAITLPEKTEEEKENYNQLIVPKGKRSFLVLADGSKLWVNAGTKVIYPVKFLRNKREIFVEGEVYLEVFHNEKSPFTIRTDKFDVQVLGTTFNINAYKNWEASVVLVEGSINIKDTQSNSIKLSPNELISITEKGIGKKQNVNAKDYISWIDGLLILYSEPVGKVFDKLSLYYGTKIIYNDAVKDFPLSGKIDLKDDLKEVLRLISKTVPFHYKEENESIYISKKDEL